MTKKQLDKAKRFIVADIEREIQLAKVSKSRSGRTALKKLGIRAGGGNVLAALGLLCYTEFCGKLKFNLKKSNGKDAPGKNFEAFFKELGPAYSQSISPGVAYDIFRCGLAHEYYVKKDCTIGMASRSSGPGIGSDEVSGYFFWVEDYYRDFKKALDKLQTNARI
jgi:hypothetical protein